MRSDVVRISLEGRVMEELSDYGADLETIRSAGDQVSSRAGDVENLGDDVDTAHVPAQQGVAGLLEGPMRTAPLPVTLGAFKVMQSSLIAGAAVGVFANAVSVYNAGVADLRFRWRELSLADELVDERVRSDDPAERAEGRSVTRERFLAARQVLEDTLDTSAGDAVALLTADQITDEMLTQLWNQGALVAGAEHAFPHSNFLSQVDPDERWAAIEAEYFPEQLDEYGNPYGITAERVEALELNDESVAELRAVLDVSSATAEQEMLIARLGDYDSGRVLDAANGTPDGDTLTAIAEGTSSLQRINDRASERNPLTDAERAYLLAWFALTPDQLFRQLPNGVSDAVNHTMLGVPEAEQEAYFNRTRNTYLRPVADAMLNLSNPVVGGYGMSLGDTLVVNDMNHVIVDRGTPQITEFNHFTIGVPTVFESELAEQDGYPYPLVADDASEPVAVYLLGAPAEHEDARSTLDHVDAWRDDPDVFIPNLDRFVGFSHLMDSSTVQGGETFMRRLGEHVDLVEQQLNELPESHEESLAATFRALLGEDGEYMGLSPDELGDHFASEDRLVEEIEDQLEHRVARGHEAVDTIRSVVERN